MNIDPLETARQALADFGVEVTVTPLDGSAQFPLQALFSPKTTDASLGQMRGAMQGPVFRGMPDDAAAVSEGDILTLEGANYAAFEPVAIPGKLTEIRTVPR